MTDHQNSSAGIESAGFSDIEAAQAIASIANECCYRSDGWEEHIAEEGLKIIRSIRGTPTPAQPAAVTVEEIAKLVDPIAHEMYDAAYAAKDWPDQMTWIKRLEASREKASNILFRLNPPPAATVETSRNLATGERDNEETDPAYFHCSAGNEDEKRIPLSDHDAIGRAVLSQPWEVQKAIVTITAHCTCIMDEEPSSKVSDLAGCISHCCKELADALTSTEPQAAPVTQQDVTDVIAWAKEHDLPVPLALFAHFKMSRGTSPLPRPQRK